MVNASSPQSLSAKDQSLFRTLVKDFETKQYKKGIKAADQILKRNPNNGETLAMKGLILNSLGRKNEGYDLAKKGLRNDLTSPVCWHVLGLLHKSDQNYTEAMKCYANTLKYDKENQQILRDQSVLQIHARMYKEFGETRAKLLRLRPDCRQNWSALAIAHHLQKNHKQADQVLSSFEGTIKRPLTHTSQEHSEALLYHNVIIAETGDYQKALTNLDEIEVEVLDKLNILELRAEYLLNLKRFPEAIKAYELLLERNCENHQYFLGFERAHGLVDAHGNISDVTKLYDIYKSLQCKIPDSSSAKTIPFKFLNGEDFRNVISIYLKNCFVKGIPSAFVSIKYLYADESKRNIIQSCSEEILASIRNKNDLIDKDLAALPTTILWVMYFLAQHFDTIGERDRALEFIDAAIDHTPILVELHITKAKILKHQNHLQSAMERMNFARELDLQDRFVNSKCSKYMLRNDKVELALATITPFTRQGVSGGPLADLSDIQNLWFLVEMAESYSRQKQFNLALYWYSSIWKIFELWIDDQFDFHTFVTRKGTIRSYMDLLRWEDQLPNQAYYKRVALGAARIYMELYDDPDFKLRLIDNKRKVINGSKIEQTTKDPGSATIEAETAGIQLMNSPTLLDDALKYLRPLMVIDIEDADVHLLAYEVYSRKGDFGDAFSELASAYRMDPHAVSSHAEHYRDLATLNKLKKTDFSSLNDGLASIIFS